jgi:hypothetical protein
MTEADFTIVRTAAEAVMQMQTGLIQLLAKIIDWEAAEETATNDEGVTADGQGSREIFPRQGRGRKKLPDIVCGTIPQCR